MADYRDAIAELEEGGVGEDRLIFPINVHDSIQASKGLKPSEKNGIIVSIWVAVSLGIGWFAAGWLRTVSPNYYFWIVLVGELVLQLTVGVFILRFVLDENTMMSEMNKVDKSFAKYFGIYHEIKADDKSTYPCDVIEFVDGSHGAYIMMLLGYNTNQSSSNTYAVNLAIQKMLNKSGMQHRITYSNEKFSNSDAADGLRGIVNGIKDPTLFTAYRDIVQNLLDKANNESNVLCVVYQIYAKTRSQKEDLGPIVTKIVETVNSEQTAYRSCFAMNYKEISEFYRLYYKLEILDMGIVRVISASKQNRTFSPVRLIKVYGKSGKSYTTADFAKLKVNVLDTYGLKQVNAPKPKAPVVEPIPFDN